MRPKPKRVTWTTVRPIVILCLVLTVAAGIWRFTASPPSLDAETAFDVLAGNTVYGGWGREGSGYRQYFDADGTTHYLAEGLDPAVGTWWVEDDGRVCSALPGSAERCHGIGRREQAHFWIDAVEEVGYPFELLPGRQLSQAVLQPVSRARDGLGDHAGF